LPEIVYVLVNEAMPGLVKVGMTTTSIEQRIRELDTTSVPLPFQCYYAAEVNAAISVEKKLHHIFSDKRVRTTREFFRIDANQVKSAIQLAELREITPRTDIVSDIQDTQALKAAIQYEERRSRLKFTNLGIHVGATLVFVKDPQITCEVVADGKVNYGGEHLSPSAAALAAAKALGYNWSAVSGSEYWMFNDETLSARRSRIEENGDGDQLSVQTT
jgi:hypothetical protein